MRSLGPRRPAAPANEPAEAPAAPAAPRPAVPRLAVPRNVRLVTFLVIVSLAEAGGSALLPALTYGGRPVQGHIEFKAHRIQSTSNSRRVGMNALTAACLSGYAFFSLSGALLRMAARVPGMSPARGLSRHPCRPPGPNLYADAGDLSRVHAAWCYLGQPFTAGGRRRAGTFSPFQRASLFQTEVLLRWRALRTAGSRRSPQGVKIFELGQPPQGDVSGIAAVHVVRDDTKHLYDEVRRMGGITIPHTSATEQGTDWRDNDPEPRNHRRTFSRTPVGGLALCAPGHSADLQRPHGHETGTTRP